jgi:hypothetical protein
MVVCDARSIAPARARSFYFIQETRTGKRKFLAFQCNTIAPRRANRWITSLHPMPREYRVLDASSLETTSARIARVESGGATTGKA